MCRASTPAACPVLLLWARNNITVKAAQICINRRGGGERGKDKPCPSDIRSRRMAKWSFSFSLSLSVPRPGRIILEENFRCKVIERVRRKYPRCNASLGIEKTFRVIDQRPLMPFLPDTWNLCDNPLNEMRIERWKEKVEIRYFWNSVEILDGCRKDVRR